MSAELVIDTAGPEAAAIFAALHAKCFAKPWREDAVATLLRAPGGGGVLARRARFPIGFAIYRLLGDEAEVLTIGVVPAARGNGVGAAVLAAMTAACREAGSRALVLEVGEGNAAARALYAKSGFAPAGRRPGYYALEAGGREDAIILRLGLD